MHRINALIHISVVLELEPCVYMSSLIASGHAGFTLSFSLVNIGVVR